MRIKNTAVKVIGVAGIDLNPGSDWVEVANEKVYVPVFNERGVKTDKLQVLPALQLLKRMGQIDYLEDEKPVAESSDGAPAGDGGEGEKGNETGDGAPVEPKKTGGRKPKAKTE